MPHLRTRRKGLRSVLVSRELHEDGEPHLHCYLYYEKEFSCKNERFLTFLVSILTSSPLSPSGLFKLISRRTVTSFKKGMDYAQEVSAITAHKAILGKRLIDGESLVDLTKSTQSSFSSSKTFR